MILLMLLPGVVFVANNVTSVYGDTQSDLDNKKNEKAEIDQQIKDTQAQIADLKKQASNTEAYIKSLDSKMSEITSSLDSVNNKIADLQAQIKDAEVKLTQAEADSEEQYQSMKLRIKFMYEHNSEDYLAILVSSTSMGDLLNKAEYIAKISEYDRQMLVRLEETMKLIADTKAQLESDYVEVDSLRVSLEAQMQAMETVQAEKVTQLKQLQSNTQLAQSKEDHLHASSAKLDSEIADILDRLTKPTPGGSQGTTGTGVFVWPTVSHRITSDWGDTEDRSGPHKGIDIGAVVPGRWGDDIYAADSGTVKVSESNSSAGNWIWIDHGNGLITVYMHCDKLLVSVGNTVTKGQKIATMGSTGNSTGAHLHFGVFKNGVYTNPWNYLR
jgi:murein DD-endopeptidase MepM/ murein hydrolase activator NlpD